MKPTLLHELLSYCIIDFVGIITCQNEAQLMPWHQFKSCLSFELMSFYVKDLQGLGLWSWNLYFFKLGFYIQQLKFTSVPHAHYEFSVVAVPFDKDVAYLLFMTNYLNISYF